MLEFTVVACQGVLQYLFTAHSTGRWLVFAKFGIPDHDLG